MQSHYAEWLAFITQAQPKRAAHCVQVAEMAVQLAEKLGLDKAAAYEAGLLHDCAKGLPQEEQRALMAQWRGGLDLTDFPKLWHAPASAVLARERWQVCETVQWAIARHAPAQPGMTVLQKVIYAADKTEPTRTYAGAKKLHDAVWRDFETGFAMVVADEAAGMLRQFRTVHPAVIEGWNQYIRELYGDMPHGTKSTTRRTNAQD